MNFVLGTHYDLIDDDNLKEMNEELMSSLKPDVESNVVPNVRRESIIFPVNTLVPEDEGRMKAGQDLCQSIANCGGTSLKIKMPIRWFAFELWLQKVAGDKSRSFLIIGEVISAGARLKMSEDDTKDALKYLHNVTIILYYPDILPQLVFVDPKPILEVLSCLLALTYIERKALHLIANPVPPEKDISKLYNVGFFKEKLLKDYFKSLFSSPHFEPSHLLELLIHLHIIASGKDGDYFIPCALESYTDPPEPQTGTKPLLIVWQDNDGINTLPVPQGMFPLVITHLLSHNEYHCKVDFPPLDPTYILQVS
uniref:C-terminal of Roc (COR) domain-containing protein n=1 Tax=Amphimedon queenslandica TaxID=400682 RepID=A0A1X7SLC8_AMPQE